MTRSIILRTLPLSLCIAWSCAKPAPPEILDFQASVAPPLAVEIIRPPTRKRPKSTGLPPAPPISLGKGGELTIDGVASEAWWASVPKLPPLLPLAAALAPEQIDGRLAETPDGIALFIAKSHLPITVALDPDGLQQRRWDVTVSPKAVDIQYCSAKGKYVGHVDGVAAYLSFPCVPANDVAIQRGSDGIEIFWSWEVLDKPSARMQLALVTGTHSGGTWNQRGSKGILSAFRPLKRPGRATVKATTDRENNEVLAAIRVTGMKSSESWDWTLWDDSEIIERGTATIKPREGGVGTTTIRVEYPQRFQMWFEVRPSADPSALPNTGVGRFRLTAHQASITTPVYTDHIDIFAYLSDEATDTPIWVRGPTGESLAATTASIPAGMNVLRITPDAAWPRMVDVRVGTLMDWKTVVRGSQ